MFGLGQIGKLGALASSVARAWSPLALWPNGIASPGMWISPRTLDSQWQDYTGTTPVAVPGTVADSSNPVGLALDIRAGAPEVLGPELVVNGGFSDGTTGWSNLGAGSISAGKYSISAAAEYWVLNQTFSVTPLKTYQIDFDFTLAKLSAPALAYLGVGVAPGTGLYQAPGSDYSAGHTSLKTVAGSGQTSFTLCWYFIDAIATISNISVREVPGLHMLQSTSVDRPLLSAYDGQTLGPGDTYSAAGYPVFQKYNGTNSSMVTAAFAAGTLIDGMDCMIAVRRDSAVPVIIGCNGTVINRWFGGAGSGATADSAGSTTYTSVLVDGATLSGGANVTAGTLHTALTVGAWHILEYRGLNLSLWTAFGAASYAGYLLNGARGDIMLYPSTDSTEDKDAARQWLADYYGVTLP